MGVIVEAEINQTTNGICFFPPANKTNGIKYTHTLVIETGSKLVGDLNPFLLHFTDVFTLSVS